MSATASASSTEDPPKYKLPPPNYHRKGSQPKYINMWPIALAPAIPLIGIAFKKQPKIR